MGDNGFKDLSVSLGKMNIPKIEPILPNMNYLTHSAYDFDLTKKRYHSPEEILEEDKDEFERPDFSEWRCKICNKPIEEGYFWYYLKHEEDEDKSFATCSNECLDELVNSQDCCGYEIYEYSRCNAYFKCEEIGNLRNMCETVENKTYQSIMPMVSINHCQPAQAGTILSTHKLTEVLMGFSKQTEEQFLSNKEMMEQSSKESSKQFKITTWMTVLVLILTIVNLVPTFLNIGADDYFEQLIEIKSTLSEISSKEELSQINTKLGEVVSLINSSTSNNDERIVELLELIQEELKNITTQ